MIPKTKKCYSFKQEFVFNSVECLKKENNSTIFYILSIVQKVKHQPNIISYVTTF